jgi:uncharacterized protein YdaL
MNSESRGKCARVWLSATLLFLSSISICSARSALIVYDNQPNQAYGKLGYAYAIMINNLLGHFKFDGTLMDIKMLPVEQYSSGDVETADTTFYIGSYYDNLIPKAFLDDVMKTDKTVVWFKNNLWKLAWDSAYGFSQKFGFTFQGLRGFNTLPTAASPNPGFYDTVTYQRQGQALQTLKKHYQYDATTGSINADPDMGETAIMNSETTHAVQIAGIENSVTRAQAPYVVRSSNFWYFADTPFSFIGPRDRYLVFCDLLHDILGSTQAESHSALVRLEDVSALSSESNIKLIADTLYNNGVNSKPFAIATIPYYRDPQGVFNGGKPMSIRFASTGAAALRRALSYSLTRGGSIVLHGLTHQLGNGRINARGNYVFTSDIANPFSGLSADDFEFWNVVNNTPVTGDSEQWAVDRINAGRKELASVSNPKFAPFAWEVPHYKASPNASRAAAKVFPNTYQRVTYFTSQDGSNLVPNGNDFSFGQFFPYVIYKDFYGQKVIPENIGNIEYDISACDSTSSVTYTADDLITNAAISRSVIRDGFASFFFHPFWLDDFSQCGIAKGTGLSDFKRVIHEMGQQGYVWTDARSL